MSMIGELRQVPTELIPAFADEATQSSAAETVMESEGLSLGKAWNALDYLLRGRCAIDPMGGATIDEVDTGYGPPGLLTADEVRTCARELAAIDEQVLRDAYDPAAMAAEDIYPSIWDREDERASNLTWLLSVFREMRTFYAEAAERGHGVLYFLT
jgi:hypothetical protein